MSDTYMDVLDELKELTLKKRAGYSPGADPYKNFRMTEMFSLPCEDCGHPTPIPAIFGIMIREMDKMARIASLLAKPSNEQVGETLRETMMDAGNYPLIGVAYTDNEQQEKQSFANMDELLDTLFPYDTPPSDDGLPAFTGFPDGTEEDVFDSSDMEPPEDVDTRQNDLVLTVESDGSISTISGGPLEEPVSTGPDLSVIECCPPDCDECMGECRPGNTDCDPNCTGCIARMYERSTAGMDNAKSKDHDPATCSVCQYLAEPIHE